MLRSKSQQRGPEKVCSFSIAQNLLPTASLHHILLHTLRPFFVCVHMGVSKKNGTPKSSILVGLPL